MQRALVAFQRGDAAGALAGCRAVLATSPDDFDALHVGGVAAAHLGRLDEALPLLERAVRVGHGNAEAAMHLGIVLMEAGRPDAAVTVLDRAVTLAPGHALAHYNHASALQRAGRLEGARVAYDRALELAPDSTPALRNRGDVALAQGRPDAALADYDRVVAQGAADAGLLVNRAVALDRMGRAVEALECLDAAVRADGGHADAHFNRGNVLRGLRRLDHAVAAYDSAVVLRPGFVAAWQNRGAALNQLGRFDDAIASFDRALVFDAAYADAWMGRGNALRALDRDAEALTSYTRARELAPEADFLLGTWLHAKATVCDWAGLEAGFATLAEQACAGRKASPPFPALAMPLPATVHREIARTWIAARHPPRTNALPSPAPREGRRLRVGYFAATLHEHATAYLMAELFERHKRARFEVHAYSFGPDTGDAMRARLLRAFEHFHDVRADSDEAIAARARAHGLDIAVDLMGHTRDGRPDIFAFRAAPVQVAYLGYPGTMGASYIDYVIADHHVLPRGDEALYDERIVRLPGSYQVNDRQRAIAFDTPTRASQGLPPDGFVFCCFNNSHKILAPTFDAWMRILRAVPGSVLWLLEDNAPARANLVREAARRGIDPERLVFAPRVPLAQHLARHRLADLALDTLPYNAHTTASDALWAGVPMVTQAGDTFAGRVGASLLAAARLPELVTATTADYEALACALARDAARLRALRAALGRHRADAPLFDAARFTRHLEAAFERMAARHEAGRPPESFDVDAS